MREQHPVAPHLIFQRQGLRLELDPVMAGEVRPHVQLGGRLQVRVAELEDDLWVADGEAVFVGDALAQDERVVVELEVGGVQEEHFPDRGLQDDPFVIKADPALLRRLRH